MSRPRHHWYGMVKHMACRYYDLVDCCGMQDYLYKDAIDRALGETAVLSYGKERIEAIEQILFLQRRTVAGVAYDMHFSEYTVQRWINQFINLVGRYAGFKTNE